MIEWHEVSHLTFGIIFEDARLRSDQIREATSEDVPEGRSCFLSEDLLSGFVISEDGELTNVFSLERGRGDALVTAAIDHGASHLDCFDGYLPTLYARHGFVETSREANWTPGQPDVVFMALV